jgi:cytosine/creatinine deaminase
MTDRYEALVQNARLRQQNHGTVDIGISGGRIAEIAARLDGEADVLIDAEGCLVTESFVNPHLHLCKVYTLDRLNDEALKAYHGDGMGSAMHAIELAAGIKEQLDCESMLINLRKGSFTRGDLRLYAYQGFCRCGQQIRLGGCKGAAAGPG